LRESDTQAGHTFPSEVAAPRYLQPLEFPKEIQKILDGKLITMAHATVLADFAVLMQLLGRSALSRTSSMYEA
jgi:hypothetical protein